MSDFAVNRADVRAADFSERFWAKVQKGAGCWEWTAWRSKKGYGRFSIGYMTKPATHVSWFLEHGEWPPAGLMVRHRCDNPPCVNPDHLVVGTSQDNMQDAMSRRPHLFPGAPPRTHCAQGHELVGDNVHVRADGERRCLECRRAGARRRKRTAKVERLREALVAAAVAWRTSRYMSDPAVLGKADADLLAAIDAVAPDGLTETRQEYRAAPSATPADTEERLREALEWYEGRVSLCNNFLQEGHDARDALARDGGNRARAALSNKDTADVS